MHTSWLSLKPCRNDTLYLKPVDWKINTFELHCWACALYPSGKLSLLMANALKKHKSPKATLVLHCSCIVAANINQSFCTCEVEHCPWSSVTEPRPTFDMFWIIAPAWKCLVSFLKQLYFPLNYPNKRHMLNRTSSGVLGTGHWGPDFANTDAHAHLLHRGDFRKPHGSPFSPPALTSPSLPFQWAKSLSIGPLFLTFFPPSFPCLPSAIPMQSSSKAPCDRERDLLLPTEAREEYFQDWEHKDVLLLLLLLVPPLQQTTGLWALCQGIDSPQRPQAGRGDKILSWPLFCWDQWTQGHWRSFSFHPDGPCEAHSASGYHTASWPAQ